jgi:hypothetical protein
MESNESKTPSVAQAESTSADRRAFMKTVVTGTVAAGLVATAGKAEAAVEGTCGAAIEVPNAVVKARVLLNNQMQIDRNHIIDVIGGIFDGSVCAACGLGGYPGTKDPRSVTEIKLERAYLPQGQLSAVIFTESGGDGC